MRFLASAARSIRFLFAPNMESGVVCSVLLLFFSVFSCLEANSAFDFGGENLAPLANGLLKFDPTSLEFGSPNAGTKFPLVLAEKRTRRPDVLRKFRTYVDGWDITNKHYWASVAYTGGAAFVLAFLWLILFGLALAAHYSFKCRIGIKEHSSSSIDHIRLILLVVFTCTAGIGCILLSVGQHGFHSEVASTMNFVVNQSEFTIEILRNVTEFLSLAKTINVDQIILPSEIQNKIDKLNVELKNADSTLSNTTSENSARIEHVLDQIRCTLLLIAALMFCLTIVGFVLSILGYQNAIYIFILSAWLLIVVTIALCGVFVILDNAISDSCTAMDEWVENPQAQTALSNILPCVDERTSNQTLLQSKQVIVQLVILVNVAINTNNTSYNQSGPPAPSLCSPYDPQLNLRQCGPHEVSLPNASEAWLDYTCEVSATGMCSGTGRLTPDMYQQLMVAVNASYALDHYTPLLLSLRNCSFVRDTFSMITSHYCRRLEVKLTVVTVGLGMISVGIVLCLGLWILYANRHQREEVFANTDNKDDIIINH